MRIEDRLKAVEQRLDGQLAENAEGRVCFVQNGNVVRWWPDSPDVIELAVEYLEYTADRCGV